MEERLGEMRKGRRERIEKGSRDKQRRKNEKRELRRQFEEEGIKNQETLSHGQVTQGSHKYISSIK